MSNRLLHTPISIFDYSKLVDQANCGISFIADKNGRTRKCVSDTIKVAACNKLRGGRDALQTSSDGVGIVTEIPWELYGAYISSQFGQHRGEGEYGMGMLFLPDYEKGGRAKEVYDQSKEIIEHAVRKTGLQILGWRDIPVNIKATGAEAIKTIGKPTQLFIDRPKGMSEEEFRKAMFTVANTISKDRRDAGLTIDDLCVASMSNRDICFKALCLPEQIANFYPDFLDDRYKSKYALVHIRFSTNTKSKPPSAQPVTGRGTAVLAHNGEMNNYIGAARAFELYMHERGHVDFYFPEGISDSNMFSSALEALMEREGWSLPAAMMMLNPPSIKDVPKEYRPMVELFMKTFKPWRGPANLVAMGDAVIDGKRTQIVLGHGDTGLQRPAAITNASNLFYLGSETGLLNVAMNATLKQAALRSGDFIAYDIDGQNTYGFSDILRIVNTEAEQKLGRKCSEILADMQIEMPQLIQEREEIRFESSIANLTQVRKQAIYNWDDEAIRYYVEPMMRTGKDNVIAMGWDVADPEYHSNVPPMHFLIKHRFAQLTSSVIDAYREKDFMPLDMDIGAEHTIVANAKRINIKSPLLRENQLKQIEELMATHPNIEGAKISFTYGINETLADALERIADEAETRVREGKSVLILSDMGITQDRVAIPAFLATAAVSKRLKDRDLSCKASIIVQSGQVYDFHHAAILLAQGASAVDPFMMPGVADQLTKNGTRPYIDPNEAGKKYNRDQLLDNMYAAMDFGLQTIISKMGVDDMRGYQASSLLEAEGLNLEKDAQPALNKIFDGVSYLRGSIGIEAIDAGIKTNHKEAIKPGHVYKVAQRGLAEQPANAEAAPHIHGSDVEVGAFRNMIGKFNIARAKTPEVSEKLDALFAAWNIPADQPVEAKIEQAEQKVKIAGLGGNSAGLKKHRELMGALHQMDVAFKEAVLENRLLTKITTPEYIRGFDRTENFKAYQEYAAQVEKNRKHTPKTPWDLMTVNTGRAAIPIEQVQPVDEILSRIFMADMSFGALTKIAHTWIDSGFNIIADTLDNGHGPVSTSGEGGIPVDLVGKEYAPRRYQVGTSQFGLTPEALAQSERIIFKAGQGAKPGMGGELPANKVDVLVAINRGSMPHSGLSSPPSHDDVKSIEDWTLKCLALRAAGIPVDLKMVSQLALGPQLTGAQKAMLMSGLDEKGKTGTITVSGNVGGTAASPITASAHSGMTAFKGLRIADRALRESGLRDYSSLTSDGGVTTGADALRRVLTGADSVGIGTALMQAVGCIMMRQCNKFCGPGVATNPELFAGAVDDVVDYLLGFAHDIRHEMAKAGISNLNEITGHTEFLQVDDSQIKSAKVKRRFNIGVIEELLKQVQNIPADPVTVEKLKEPPKYFDDAYVSQVLDFYKGKQAANDSRRLDLTGDSTNCDIALGAKISVEIARQKLARKAELESQGLEEAAVLEKIHREYGQYDQVVLNVTGRTGQEMPGEINFGAAGQYAGFLVANGLTVNLTGMAHDSCASGLGVGGVVTLRPPYIEGYQPHENNIVKNHALLSATGGKFFAAGSAGRNFAARNGGAEAVVEGVGDYACKFMGSGTVINLGKFGRGLCSAMAGGVFIQYDKQNKLTTKIDKAMNILSLEECPEQEATIHSLLTEHAERTGSLKAAEILANWEVEKANFKVAIPKEILLRQGQQKEDIRTVLEVRRGENGENGVSRGEIALANGRLWSDRVLGSQTLKSAGLDIGSYVKKQNERVVA